MQDTTGKEDKLIVELRGAPIPKPLHKMALHLYFVIHPNGFNNSSNQENLCERWELWQNKDAFQKVHSTDQTNKSQCSYGHIHKNLKSPLDDVGGGPSFPIKKWVGDEAQRIKQIIYRHNENYIYQSYYLAWPGPNSNTYISSVLEDSQISFLLPKGAIGKDWRGILSFSRNKESKVLQFQLLTFGFKFVRNSYLEIHFLGFTLSHYKTKN